MAPVAVVRQLRVGPYYGKLGINFGTVGNTHTHCMLGLAQPLSLPLEYCVGFVQKGCWSTLDKKIRVIGCFPRYDWVKLNLTNEKFIFLIN